MVSSSLKSLLCPNRDYDEVHSKLGGALQRADGRTWSVCHSQTFSMQPKELQCQTWSAGPISDVYDGLSPPIANQEKSPAAFQAFLLAASPKMLYWLPG